MIRNKISVLSVGLALSMVASNVAIAKEAAKAPTGAERAKQYEKVIRDCQKRFGGGADVSAEWAGHYGRTGWWCVSRRG